MRVHSTIVLALAATGCSVTRSPGFDEVRYGFAGTPDSARRASSMVLARMLVAEIVGLPALAYSALPAGVREIRLELGCDLCMPQHLVRMIEHVEARSTRGVVYTAFVAPGDSETGEEQREHAAAIRAAADSIALAMRCGPWEVRRLGFGRYQWCASRPRDAGEWSGLLDQLVSLGVLGLGSELGYSPRPPTAEAARAAMLDSTVTAPDATCQDIGGRSLLVETLEGRSFRQAHFWCLEAADGEEHIRASQALQILREFAGIGRPSGH